MLSIFVKTVFGESYTFTTLKEYLDHDMFDGFQFVEFKNYRESQLPERFPHYLQILIFNKSGVSSFPENLPTSIKNIYCYTSKIVSLPDLSNLTELEEFDIHDNYLEVIDAPLPPKLKTFNVSFNRLREIKANIPNELVSLNLSYNVFDTDVIDMKKEVLVNKTSMFSDAYQRKNVKTIYESEKPVHDTSIQNSILENFNKLSKKLMIDDTKELRTIDYIINELEKHDNTIFRMILHFLMFQTSRINPHLKKWCMDTTIHSVYGVTYKKLVQSIYSIIETHENKFEMEERMIVVIENSMGCCFIDRFSRMITLLSGLVVGDYLKKNIPNREDGEQGDAQGDEQCDAQSNEQCDEQSNEQCVEMTNPLLKKTN